MTTGIGWPRCAQRDCGHSKDSHNEVTMEHECQSCECDSYVPKLSMAELVQLRAKVSVYETRNETQVKSIEALKKELNEKDGKIAYMQRVSAGLKKVTLAHQEMNNLLVEAGRISKEFADVFLPPPTTAEDDLVEAHICEDDYCNEH